MSLPRRITAIRRASQRNRAPLLVALRFGVMKHKILTKALLIASLAVVGAVAAPNDAAACGPYVVTPEMEARSAVFVALRDAGAAKDVKQVDVALNDKKNRGNATVTFKKGVTLRLKLVSQRGAWRVRLA